MVSRFWLLSSLKICPLIKIKLNFTKMQNLQKKQQRNVIAQN